jgi:hypothetical protein
MISGSEDTMKYATGEKATVGDYVRCVAMDGKETFAGIVVQLLPHTHEIRVAGLKHSNADIAIIVNGVSCEVAFGHGRVECWHKMCDVRDYRTE